MHGKMSRDTKSAVLILTLLAVAFLSTGCRRTDVIAAAHAPPNESASGIVLHQQGLGSFLSVGVVAVNDGRTDVSWETRKGSKELWACRGILPGGGPPACQPARFLGAEPPKDLIQFLAPPIARARTASHPDDSTLDTPPDDLVLDPVAVPRHGVWIMGKTGFITSGVYHCVLSDEGPVCATVNDQVLFGYPMSRHIVRKDNQSADVLWLGGFGALTRCQRIGDSITCQAARVE
jgi:hypothetical protein